MRLPSRQHLRWRVDGFYAFLEIRVFSLYWRARAPHVLGALGLIPEDKVLEVGSGAGTWTSYIAPRVQHMSTIELDMSSIRKAQEWKSPSGPILPTLSASFVQGSGDRLPFKSNVYSKVFAVDVLEHILDDKSAIMEMARVLFPGGTLVITTLLHDRPSYIRRLVFEDHVREYSLDSLQELAKEANLKEFTAFYFYRAPQMIARELQVFASRIPFFQMPGIRLLVNVPLLPIGEIERFIPLGQPAGIGFSAVKA